ASIVGAFVDRGLLDVEASLGDYWDPGRRDLAALRISHLLSHSSALPYVSPLTFGFVSPATRHLRILAMPLVENFDPENGGAHNDVSPYHLLGTMLETMSGQSLRELVEAYVVEPLGLRDELMLGMTPETYERLRDRLNCNVMQTGARLSPLYAECAPN